MARTTTTVLDPGGHPVVRHEAGPGPAADALRHEAEVLERAQGPGVVVLVGAGGAPDGGAHLTARYVPGGTLVHLTRTEGEPGALAALAEVAETLARLHRLGVVHGRCTADHVVGDVGSVALCGFSAAVVGDAGEAPDTSLDRSALAALVDAAVDAAGPRAAGAHRIAEEVASGRTGLEAAARELRALAATGAAPGAAARPLRPRRAPGGRSATSLRDRGAGSGRGRLVAGALALALVVAGTATTLAGGGGRDGDGGWAAPRPAPTTAEPGPTPTAPADPVADPADGAPEPGDGSPVVDHDGGRWAVGRPGDLVVVGDWDCDGIPTAAVVRPGDGVVWAFPGWEDDEAVPLGYVASPAGAVAVPSGDGCDLLRVTTTDGQEVVVGG